MVNSNSVHLTNLTIHQANLVHPLVWLLCTLANMASGEDLINPMTVLLLEAMKQIQYVAS